MSVREEIVRVLFDEAQAGWDEHDIGIAADAVEEADDRDDIAHVLWSMGMSAEHDGCPYADGEGDADYSNDCPTCEAHLERVAERIRAVYAAANVEICGAELNADSRPCQSERGHSGDHWTPSDQADKPMWWPAGNHEVRGREGG